MSEPARHSDHPEKGRKRTADQLKQIGAVVAVAFGILFVLLNTQRVTIHWVFFTSHAPLIVALLVAAVFGAIAAFAFSRVRSRRARRHH